MDNEKLRRWYEEEIKRKDKTIELLKKQNEVLLKTAVQQSRKLVEWQNHQKKAATFIKEKNNDA